MAFTTLSDLFDPEIYADIQVNNTIYNTAFLASGVVTTDALLTRAAQSGTQTIEVPRWNDIDLTAEPNYSDESNDTITPRGIATSSFKARNSYLNNAWGATDLSREIGRAVPGTPTDPMTQIKTRTSAYWQVQLQERIFAIARGIRLANTANNNGDMVVKVAAEATGSVTADTKFTTSAFIDAVYTMGDQVGDLRMIAMHSVIMKGLAKAQLLDTMRDADGRVLYDTFMGYRVLVSDSMPVRAGTTSGLVYTCILFGPGAFGIGEGSPPIPAEVHREPLVGQGGGRELFIERKTWLIHPTGHNWLEDTLSEVSPTLADLKLAANWARVDPRKKVPLAFLEVNA